MLVLSRKIGERIMIGDNIAIMVVRIGPNSVRLGIDAPRDMNIVREELVTTEEFDAAMETACERAVEIVAEQVSGQIGQAVEVASEPAAAEQAEPALPPVMPPMIAGTGAGIYSPV